MDNDDTRSTGSSQESLEQKHNRLLAEFAKVRSQLTVLKSVVVEEKNAATGLKNKMRQKDQSIRRLEQEAESLRFCNGQIQCRLVQLQADLKERDSKPQKNSRKKEVPVAHDGPSSNSQELNADFIQLVEINAQLSSKLNSVQSEFEATVTGLEAKLRTSEASAKAAAAELSDYRNMYESLERRIRTESDMSTQREVADLKQRVHDLTIEKTSMQSDFSRAKSEIEALHQDKLNSVQQSELVRQLTQQIDSQKEQLLRLQQEKEKFLMEVQMLKFRQENNAGGDLVKSESSTSLAQYSGDSNNLAEHFSAQDRLKSRVTTLISDLQHADGKAFYYQAECAALHLRLQLAEEKKDSTRLHLSDAQHHIDDLKKQLETTVIQTNEQMSLMSEHLATMNEKLQDKTDEINTLKFELQQTRILSAKGKAGKASR